MKIFSDDVPPDRRPLYLSDTVRRQVTPSGARGGAMEARYLLVAAMNPSPCGHRRNPRHDCRCPQHLVERYRSRISGALLDRIDMYV